MFLRSRPSSEEACLRLRSRSSDGNSGTRSAVHNTSHQPPGGSSGSNGTRLLLKPDRRRHKGIDPRGGNKSAEKVCQEWWIFAAFLRTLNSRAFRALKHGQSRFKYLAVPQRNDRAAAWQPLCWNRARYSVFVWRGTCRLGLSRHPYSSRS
jgi:hypothetical protein